MPQHILMIEDDHRLAQMVGEYLGQAGYRFAHAGDAASGLAAVYDQPPDLVVLDLMLPDGDGLDVCRRIRERTDVPVLMLTARGDPTDRVVGLEVGADDYVPKPFDPRELLARVRAVLRRRSAPSASTALRFGRLEIDRDAREVRVAGQAVVLTSHQYDLLLTMAEHAGKVLSRDQLMDLVRGTPLEPFDRSIDVHIARIRAVIEDDPKQPRRILTVRGAGYVFAKLQDA
ncbi:response regulator transcription factor [Niveibacterium sp. SC-1]|uniref:response regulator transcription factor n=1 Tax=Niveibacterium sp. SC-1 TaxID=3135646 RepID=UPI003120147C